MYLEELIDLVVVAKLSITFLEMLNLVETCVPNLRKKTLLYFSTLYINNKCTGGILSADILLK